MAIPSRQAYLKLAIACLILVTGFVFFRFELYQYVTLEELKSHQVTLSEFYKNNPVVSMTAYMAIYIVVTAISFPGAAVMTLAGGAIFGLIPGIIAASFASTIGGTLAFLATRFLFRDYVQHRFANKLKIINKEIEKDGALYLLSLRLLPVLPYFLLNLLMALTPIKTGIFYIITQAGMLPTTIVYIVAGTQLATIETADDIVSFNVLASFGLLAVFPWITKGFITILRRRKITRKFRKPERFEYNLVIIGGGAAGLAASHVGAAYGAKVALIEKEKMGGNCLNTLCVPSKSLIKSAKVAHYAKNAAKFGFKETDIDFDFAGVMERVHSIIRQLAPNNSAEHCTELGVDCYHGRAMVSSPWEVKVDTKVLTTKALVIATGSTPIIPDIPGSDRIRILTSDTIWHHKRLPEKLVILGGGPTGCELAQVFGRIGSRMTLVERGERILPDEDTDISELVRVRLETEGIRILTECRTDSIIIEDGKKYLTCTRKQERIHIEFTEILAAIGRRAQAFGFGLEDIGVTFHEDGTVETDQYLGTRVFNVFGAGNVTNPCQSKQVSTYQAAVAATNAMFVGFKRTMADYRVIPWTIFTDPEVARVGLNEKEARKKGIEYEITIFDMADLDRAHTESETSGVIKILTHPGKDMIIGVTIVSTHAGEMIAEFVLAMKHGLGLKKIFKTVHAYPTFAEAAGLAAGKWKKAHTPPGIFRFLSRIMTLIRR